MQRQTSHFWQKMVVCPFRQNLHLPLSVKPGIWSIWSQQTSPTDLGVIGLWMDLVCTSSSFPLEGLPFSFRPCASATIKIPKAWVYKSTKRSRHGHALIFLRFCTPRLLASQWYSSHPLLMDYVLQYHLQKKHMYGELLESCNTKPPACLQGQLPCGHCIVTQSHDKIPHKNKYLHVFLSEATIWILHIDQLFSPNLAIYLGILQKLLNNTTKNTAPFFLHHYIFFIITSSQ